ncbi:WhiB family transcriptional regulator, partial [Streptomyces sp. NPDC001499]
MPINTMTDELTWQETALCAQAGPEFFFPAPGSSTREAKQLCNACEGRVVRVLDVLPEEQPHGPHQAQQRGTALRRRVTL